MDKIKQDLDQANNELADKTNELQVKVQNLTIDPKTGKKSQPGRRPIDGKDPKDQDLEISGLESDINDLKTSVVPDLEEQLRGKEDEVADLKTLLDEKQGQILDNDKLVDQLKDQINRLQSGK